MNSQDFQPRWASPLGETVAALLERTGIGMLDLARSTEMSIRELRVVMSGAFPLNTDVAARIGAVLGGSTDFWISRDTEFRKSLERLPLERRVNSEWINAFPFSDLVRFGWISRANSEAERANQLLQFFGIRSSTQWKFRYPESAIASAFRTTFAYDIQPASVASWLRRGEKIAETINSAPWDRDRFAARLPDARLMTKNRFPSRFFPALRKLCSECGVALVAAPTPAGCPASGASLFLAKDKALLMVSFRFKTDDQFWFSFFHEAGHLVRQDIDAVFIDDQFDNENSEEEEANAFAQDLLIPPESRDEMLTLSRRARDVIRFAVQIGIAPGIVVGQLQRARVLDYKFLNGLKRRYADDEIQSVY